MRASNDPRSPRRRPADGVLDAYGVRLLVGLALSLGLAVAAARLPVRPAAERAGYGRHAVRPHPDEPVPLPLPPAPTRHPGLAPAEAAPAPDDGDGGRGGDTPPTPELQPALRLTPQRTVLDVAEQQPRIVGGLNAFYIHIDYPQAAIDAGIQGRLMLRFVVTEEGVPVDIEVLEPLHPLCDSAAVRALRRTTFVPAQQDDHAVAVRMHLPVRFRLVAADDADDS